MPQPDLRQAPVPLDAALTQILADISPLPGTERVGLATALGRILREEVVSPIDVPGADNSAVDGYAVQAADLAPSGETRLPVVGRAAAGHPFAGPVPRGTALRIFTGALMPPGPDTVVMQEDCRIENEEVLLPAGLKRGSNRRRAGEDVKAGATVLAPGLRLRPQEIGLAAAIGRRELTVARTLRVALLSAGEEPADSNREGLAAMLRQPGLAAVAPDLPRRGDAAAALAAAAAVSEVILASGDVFLDEAGAFAAAVAAGGQLRLWHLALKPGRSVGIGVLDEPRRAIVIALPGNPVAAITGLLCLARPVLLRLMGASDLFPRRYRMNAAFEYRKKPGRREFLRARRIGETEVAMLSYPAQGSGILSSLIAADGLVELPEALTRVECGSMVDFLPFGEAR